MEELREWESERSCCEEELRRKKSNVAPVDFMLCNFGVEKPELALSGSTTPIPPPRDSATRHLCRWQADRPTLLFSGFRRPTKATRVPWLRNGVARPGRDKIPLVSGSCAPILQIRVQPPRQCIISEISSKRILFLELILNSVLFKKNSRQIGEELEDGSLTTNIALCYYAIFLSRNKEVNQWCDWSK